MPFCGLHWPFFAISDFILPSSISSVWWLWSTSSFRSHSSYHRHSLGLPFYDGTPNWFCNILITSAEHFTNLFKHKTRICLEIRPMRIIHTPLRSRLVVGKYEKLRTGIKRNMFNTRSLPKHNWINICLLLKLTLTKMNTSMNFLSSICLPKRGANVLEITNMWNDIDTVL